MRVDGACAAEQGEHAAANDVRRHHRAVLFPVDISARQSCPAIGDARRLQIIPHTMRHIGTRYSYD